eukprot:7299239-Prorocentrum_lima.AAC.1
MTSSLVGSEMCIRDSDKSDKSVLELFLECSLQKLSKSQLSRLRQQQQSDFSMSSACTGSGMAE